MGKRKIGSVSFQVHGDFITDFCRSLVREGNWRKGLDSLRESIIGINSDQCYEILSGKKQLVGVNSLEYVDDDKHLNKEWIEEYYYAYFSGIFWHNRKFYKPYGYIDHLCGDDLTRAMKLLKMQTLPISSGFNGDDDEVIDLNCARADTYKRASSDFIFHSKSLHKWVISETIEQFDYPVWLKIDDLKSLSKSEINSKHKLDDEELENIDDIRKRAEIRRLKGDQDCDIDTSMIDNYVKDQDKVKDLLSDPEKIKQKISDQANRIGGWLDLSDVKTGKSYKIPKHAFYRWCLCHSSAYHAYEWPAISPSGVKMGGDDPNHTDFWLFTGLELSEAQNHYSNDTSFFFKMRHKYLKELTGSNMVRLTNVNDHKGLKSAWVRHVKTPSDIVYINKGDVVIIPTASPDFEAVAYKCAETGSILITETGGKLCHLSTVGREFGLALFMVPDAMAKYPMGCNVEVDCERAMIKALDLEVAEVMKLKLAGLRYL